MAIGEHKNQSPYHGIFVTCLVLIAVPIVFYLLVRGAIFTYQTQFSDEMNNAASRFFGFGLGMLFHISCLIAGILAKPFSAVVFRVKEFFSDLKISPKIAFACYWYNVKERGVAFWILFAVIIVNFCLFLSGLVPCLEIYFG